MSPPKASHASFLAAAENTEQLSKLISLEKAELTLADKFSSPRGLHQRRTGHLLAPVACKP